MSKKLTVKIYTRGKNKDISYFVLIYCNIQSLHISQNYTKEINKLQRKGKRSTSTQLHEQNLTFSFTKISFFVENNKIFECIFILVAVMLKCLTKFAFRWKKCDVDHR